MHIHYLNTSSFLCQPLLPGHSAYTLRFDEILATDGDASQFLTVIRGSVYDLKAFEARHPGGDVIRLSMARDASILYESYHPASSAARLAPYKVGTCADAPQVPRWSEMVVD